MLDIDLYIIARYTLWSGTQSVLFHEATPMTILTVSHMECSGNLRPVRLMMPLWRPATAGRSWVVEVEAGDASHHVRWWRAVSLEYKREDDSCKTASLTDTMQIQPAPEPKTPLGYRRLLSPTAGIRVSPLCLGGMSLGHKWAGK